MRKWYSRVDASFMGFILLPSSCQLFVGVDLFLSIKVLKSATDLFSSSFVRETFFTIRFPLLITNMYVCLSVTKYSTKAVLPGSLPFFSKSRRVLGCILRRLYMLECSILSSDAT